MGVLKHGKSLVKRLWAFVNSHEPAILIAALVVATALWIFIGLADEVLEKETAAIDGWIYNLFRSPDDPLQTRGPLWLQETARDFTALGSIPVLALFVAAVTGYLFLSRAWRTMWLVIGSTTTGLLLVTVLKRFFDRPRPAAAGDFYTSATSFPSGHSMMSAVVFLSLATLVTRVEANWRVRIYTVVVGALAAITVGGTRVYLGMHYPTDVAAGLSLGVAWALAWWIVPRYLETRAAPRLIGDEASQPAEPTNTEPNG